MKRNLIFTLLAIMLTACKSQEGVNEVQNQVPQEPTRPDYLYIVFDEQTRVEFNSKQKTIWSEGDQVIRFGTDILDVWKYTGLTGEDTDRFSFVKELNDSNNYYYNDKFYVLYSYDSYLELSFPPDGPEVLHNIKATQNYTPDTYDPKSNIMVGESDHNDIFSLRNLMGYLHIPIMGTKTISKIVITGNNNEILNGNRSIIISDPDTFYWNDNTGKSLTLDCADSVELSPKYTTEFYITLVPTVFTKGFSISIYFTDETSQSFNTDDKMTIERNKILHLQDITITDKAEPEPEPGYKQYAIIQHSGRFISFPVLNDAYKVLWGDDSWNTIEYYSEIYGSHVYIDGKESHTVTVHSNNASTIYIESCLGISEIDLTNF